jgi:TatA/E family protein of Tat protein translocase
MNLGMPEMIFIFLLALVVFGPRKLPELGRQLGKALAEFKKASNEFKNQLEVEMMNIELEERAKKTQIEQATPQRTILPAEKLFDTVSAPPVGSVNRNYDFAEPDAGKALPAAEAPTPNVPQPSPDV